MEGGRGRTEVRGQRQDTVTEQISGGRRQRQYRGQSRETRPAQGSDVRGWTDWRQEPDGARGLHVFPGADCGKRKPCEIGRASCRERVSSPV